VSRRSPRAASAALARVLAIAVVALSAVHCGRYRAVDEPFNYDVVFKDVSGAEVRLAEYKGKPLIVNFWATWCVPCQREMPQLVAMAAQYREAGLTVIGISVDDGPEDMQAFAKQFEITYRLLVGRDDIPAAEKIGYTGLLPTTIFVSARGRVEGRLIGGARDEFFHRQIQALF
jgi:thiol-disulfide isomerase/thioredoxin